MRHSSSNNSCATVFGVVGGCCGPKPTAPGSAPIKRHVLGPRTKQDGLSRGICNHICTSNGVVRNCPTVARSG